MHPHPLRLPLELHSALGYTHREVAETLEIPAGSVASRIQQGLGRLRGALAGAGVVLAVGALEVLLADVAEARGDAERSERREAHELGADILVERAEASEGAKLGARFVGRVCATRVGEPPASAEVRIWKPD